MFYQMFCTQKKQGKIKGKYQSSIPKILAITCCEISHKPSSVLETACTKSYFTVFYNTLKH